MYAMEEPEEHLELGDLPEAEKEHGHKESFTYKASDGEGESAGDSELPDDREYSNRELIRTIRGLVQQASGSQHTSDLMETIGLEREEMARERAAMAEEHQRLFDELAAEKDRLLEERDRLLEEKDRRIWALEDELVTLRADFDAEKQQREAEDAEERERDRQELIERDEFIRNQLGDITNLVQDQRDMCEAEKALMDARWEEKQVRRVDKEAQSIELRDLIEQMYNNMEAERQRAEEEKQSSRDTLENLVDDLQRQNAEQRDLLAQLSESWRADCERHHHETIEAVKATAGERVPSNVKGHDAQITSPAERPTSIDPGRESPGLFGPRSPTGSLDDWHHA